MKKIIFLLIGLFMINGACFAGPKLFVGDLVFEKVAQVGEKYEGKITLHNKGDEPCQVEVISSDYIFYSNGESFYKDPGSTPRSNAKWITFDRMGVTIAPGQASQISYIVNVPNNPDLKGTYWSALRIAPVKEIAPPTALKDDKKIQLRIGTKIVYVVQLITNIGETGSRNIKFLKKDLIKTEDGKRHLVLDVENTGERLVRLSPAVELYDKTGAYVGRYEGSIIRVYPACSVAYRIDLTSVTKGKYKAMVILDNRDENVFGAQYDLSIDE